MASWAECSLADASDVAFERCAQVRERHAFGGAKSKRGCYYFATTGELKWCESRYEMRVLRLLDHDPTVAAVGVQPFVLHYRDGAGRASHTPDVFVRRADGAGTVVDARPERFTDKAEFVRQRAATEAACAVAGWSYAVCSSIDPIVDANLDWLSPCRHQLVDHLACADLEEIADVTGMDRIRLQRYRRGETWPSWDTQRQFRALLASDPAANLPDLLPTR